MLINRYKNMILLSAKTAEELNKQIAEFGVAIELVALYPFGGRVHAHVLPGQAVKVVKKTKRTKKVSIEDVQKKLNKEK